MRCGDALSDGGLADAGLADQYRVVLDAAGEHLDRLLDLLVPPDHRLQLAVPGHRRQVLPELVERGGLALLGGAGTAAGPGVLSSLQRLRRDPALGQHPAGR